MEKKFIDFQFLPIQWVSLGFSFLVLFSAFDQAYTGQSPSAQTIASQRTANRVTSRIQSNEILAPSINFNKTHFCFPFFRKGKLGFTFAVMDYKRLGIKPSFLVSKKAKLF